MQIDVTNGKRFTEYDALAAVASGEDVLLVRLADGTGVKRIPISAIKAFINGDLDTLETEDKTSLIAAINEVFGLVGTNAQDIKALKELTTMLGQTGASRANSFIYEHDLGTSFTAEQSADIRAGKFEKVRTGGYWTINGRKYWAAHADYRLHCGDTELTTHHMLADLPLRVQGQARRVKPGAEVLQQAPGRAPVHRRVAASRQEQVYGHRAGSRGPVQHDQGTAAV